ncbi:hypothetical protein WA158_007370 [Blastocystis sp. Blastoise]
MANTRFQYVKHFEEDERVLRNTYFVVRIDGKGFHKFTQEHNFDKPNDKNALMLMNRVAYEIFKGYGDIIFAIGESDEYSFIFRRNTDLFQRRREKILTTIVSQFSSYYVFYWPEYMKEKPLLYPPSFDGRVVIYPSPENIRDYIGWRQADTHINNLYNTSFWALVLQGKKTEKEAENILKGTLSKDKNELLFTQFGINYNNEGEMFKKGSVLFREKGIRIKEKLQNHPNTVGRIFLDETKEPDYSSVKDDDYIIAVFHMDVIKPEFWKDHNDIL